MVVFFLDCLIDVCGKFILYFLKIYFIKEEQLKFFVVDVDVLNLYGVLVNCLLQFIICCLVDIDVVVVCVIGVFVINIVLKFNVVYNLMVMVFWIKMFVFMLFVIFKICFC